MGHWLLQANPKVWDVFGAAEAGEPVERWTVSRYLDRLAPGDGVAMWVSGRSAGVYALGQVVGEPYERVIEDEAEDERWLDRERAARATHVVPVHVDVPLWWSPIAKADLLADARFSDALIVRMPGGANPFPLTDEEWAAIVDAAPKASGRGGQGLQSITEIRRACELHAMAEARLLYEADGWTVEDVSASRPYDFCCTKGKLTRHVEVKGTTGTGEEVLLTAGEVRHNSEYEDMALVVVHSISVTSDQSGITCESGTVSHIVPWTIDAADLSARSYSYRVPE